MRNIAFLLMLLGLGMFIVGCGAQDASTGNGGADNAAPAEKPADPGAADEAPETAGGDDEEEEDE
jgi:hypothetical protein